MYPRSPAGNKSVTEQKQQQAEGHADHVNDPAAEESRTFSAYRAYRAIFFGKTRSRPTEKQQALGRNNKETRDWQPLGRAGNRGAGGLSLFSLFF
jgi:hypothetical protein